jgi:hypothetical protein
MTASSDDPSVPPEVPEPDALDQATPVDDGGTGELPARLERGFETPEADALDQALDAPMDDEPGQ